VKVTNDLHDVDTTNCSLKIMCFRVSLGIHRCAT